LLEQVKNKLLTINILVVILVCLGSFVGLMAGLLGIGGGLIVVPALVLLLPKAGIENELAMHIALATSLSTIVLTSASSAFNHLKLGNIKLSIVKWMIPGVLFGGFLGTYIAELVPAQYLPKIFGLIVLGLSIQMFVSVRRVSQEKYTPPIIMMLSGAGIGSVSSLAGIGGGSLMVPFLNKRGIEMRIAIGTSSLCGMVIAISGMLGFMYHGSSVENLPEYSLGYIYLPALIAIASTSMATTKIGAKLATQLPTPMLKKIFALFLLIIAVRMLF
jgi:uncharacterized membrane protein YfcA